MKFSRSAWSEHFLKFYLQFFYLQRCSPQKILNPRFNFDLIFSVTGLKLDNAIKIKLIRIGTRDEQMRRHILYVYRAFAQFFLSHFDRPRTRVHPECRRSNVARPRKELAPLFPSVSISISISVKDGRDHAKLSSRDKHVEVVRGIVIGVAAG